jgi:drug/metabolite transporter (DMT)-like permease
MLPHAILLLSNLNFLISGVVQMLLAFQLDVAGVGKSSYNNILAAVQPLGSLLICCCVSNNFQQLRSLGVKKLVANHWHLAVLDIGGGIFSQASIALIGSGIFMVIYASIVVYIAALNRIKFQRDVSTLRWISLVLITGFIVVSSLGQLESGSNFFSTVLGIVFALGATVSYGTMYVLLSDVFERDRERVNMTDEPPMSKTFLLLCVSSVETFACLLYFACAVIPMWQPWVAIPMAQSGTSFATGVVLLLLVTFIDGMHQIGFYFCTSESFVLLLFAVLLLFVLSHSQRSHPHLNTTHGRRAMDDCITQSLS